MRRKSGILNKDDQGDIEGGEDHDSEVDDENTDRNNMYNYKVLSKEKSKTDLLREKNNKVGIKGKTMNKKRMKEKTKNTPLISPSITFTKNQYEQQVQTIPNIKMANSTS